MNVSPNIGSTAIVKMLTAVNFTIYPKNPEILNEM